jgi:hypothetical protein
VFAIDGLQPFQDDPDCESRSGGVAVQRFVITAADVVSPAVSRRPLNDSAMDRFCGSVKSRAMPCIDPVVIAAYIFSGVICRSTLTSGAFGT